MPFSEQKSYMELLVERCIKLEKFLEQEYGAFGDGLGKKAKSVEASLDSEIFKKLKEIAHVRNSLIHDGINLREGREERFLSICDDVIKRLIFSSESRKKQNEQAHTESENENNNQKQNQEFNDPTPKAKPEDKEKQKEKAKSTTQSSNVKSAQTSYSSTSSRTSSSIRPSISFSFSWVKPLLKISFALITIVMVFNVGRFIIYQIGDFFSRFSRPSSSQSNSFSQTISNQPASKQIDCEKILKKAKKNKKVVIPSQCQNTYTIYQDSQTNNQAFSTSNQQNHQAKVENNDEQKREAERQKAERQRIDLEDQQRIEAQNREREEQRQRDESAAMYKNMHENQRRAKEQEQQQADADRRKEEEAERKREQARQEAGAREREKQRRIQENNERIIRLGTELKDKIFKRRN